MVTLKDIAEEAGVSVSAVSLALRDHRSISIETKQRIWEAQERLGYRRVVKRPASLSAKYKSSKPRTASKDIVFLLVDRQINASAYASIAQSLLEQTALRHWRILYATAELRNLEQGEIPVLLRSNKPDGIVVSGAYTAQAHRQLRKLGIPIVVHGRFQLGVEPWMSCEPDFSQAIGLFLQRMTELGHRRFGLYVKDPDSEFVKNLIRYYNIGIEEWGLQSMGIANVDPEGEGLSIEALVDKRPTALLVAIESLVPHLYQVCERRKISIPKDMSVMLFHYTNQLLLVPSVAGLGQCGMGAAILYKLEQLMKNPECVCTREFFPKKLIPGGSIGQAPQIAD